MDIYKTVNEMKVDHKTIFDLPIRVTFYARVSTTKEEQENSIENQIYFFQNMIKEHSNWTYIEGYVDKIRGESAANRKNFMRMIEDGKNGKFDLVLTKEVSRFARNTIDSLTYTRELLRNGVGVFFQNDNICTVDGDAEFRLTIMSSIAQDEVRKLSERVKFGHKQSIQKGVVMGNSRIYGYDKDRGKLVINEPEAEMVRLIFNLYASGKHALRSIERILYEKGYRSRSGNKIQHTTIGAIINNPKYKGYYCGNKVKIADYRTKEQIFLKEEDWVMYKDETGEIVPAIIDEETWEKAHALFLQKSESVKKLHVGQKGTSVLSGKVMCGRHNVPFWRTSYSHRLHKGENIYEWICREKKRGKSADCDTFAIYEYELYEMLRRFFVKMIGNVDDIIETFISVYKKYDDTENFNNEIKKLKVKLQNEENKKSKLLELYIDGTVSKADYKLQNDRLNNTIDSLQIEIDGLNNKIQSSHSVESELLKIRKIVKNMFDKNSTLTKDDIDTLIVNLVQKIVVTPVDKKTMGITIVLADNSSNDATFVRSCGNMSFTMCPELCLTLSSTRQYGRNIVGITYNVSYNISV